MANLKEICLKSQAGYKQYDFIFWLYESHRNCCALRWKSSVCAAQTKRTWWPEPQGVWRLLAARRHGRYWRRQRRRRCWWWSRIVNQSGVPFQGLLTRRSIHIRLSPALALIRFSLQVCHLLLTWRRRHSMQAALSIGVVENTTSDANGELGKTVWKKARQATNNMISSSGCMWAIAAAAPCAGTAALRLRCAK